MKLCNTIIYVSNYIRFIIRKTNFINCNLIIHIMELTNYSTYIVYTYNPTYYIKIYTWKIKTQISYYIIYVHNKISIIFTY